ncbi:MAG: hypothetical protein F6K09_36910, partial [Merismopedia sp. SIO2A8]|nr:hypothetical protein [Merismopedia sp. SIO2A8]
SGSLWLSDVAHHHLALGVFALLVGHLAVSTTLWKPDPRPSASSVYSC